MEEREGDWRMNWVERGLDYLATAALIAAGVVGLATRLGLGIPRLSSANNPAATALAIVAILSIAVGLERVIRFRRPEKQLFDLNETLTRSLGGQYMQGYGQVFNAVMPLTGDIEDMV